MKFIGRWGPDSGINGWLCQAQGAGIQESNFSSVLLGLVIALNALYVVFFKGSIEVIRKYEWMLIAACFMIPIPFVVIPLFLQPIPGRSMYGDANQWCWITSEYAPYQLYFWFIFLWVIFIFNLAAYLLTRHTLNTASSLLVGKRASPNAMRYRMFIIKRMLWYILAFIVVWTPSSVNRVAQLILGSPVFALSVIQSLISPARGFFNFLAYFITW